MTPVLQSNTIKQNLTRPKKIANWAKVERMYRLEIKDEVLVE